MASVAEQRAHAPEPEATLTASAAEVMELILEATAVIFANGETTEGTVAAARQAFPFEDARRRAKSTSVERERDLRPPRSGVGQRRPILSQRGPGRRAFADLNKRSARRDSLTDVSAFARRAQGHVLCMSISARGDSRPWSQRRRSGVAGR
jgi:hypothetical protein